MAEAILQRASASVVIAAAPEAVFDAWLDPAIAARFMAANEAEVGEIAIDPREGGAFRLVMRLPGRSIEHEGRYVLIDRPNRLIFTWVSPGTDHRLSLVSVTFKAQDGGVLIELEHEGLPGEEMAGRHQAGWTSILTKLATMFPAT